VSLFSSKLAIVEELTLQACSLGSLLLGVDVTLLQK
jgi:hypothetical protein